MKSKGIILLAIFYLNNLFCQNLKTYEGNFGNEGGTAKYTYYENENYERIFSGNFTLNYKPNKLSSINLIVTGNFENNLKNGVWISEEKQNTKATGNKGNKNIIKTLKSEYKNGLKNGLWVYTNISNIDGVKKSIKYTLSFKNDKIIGEVNLRNLQGQYDKNSNFTGLWKYETESKEYIADFENNIFKKLIIRKKDDGNIDFKYINENIEYFQNDSITVIGKHKFELKDVKNLQYNSNDIDINSNNQHVTMGEIEYTDKNNYFKNFYNFIEEDISNFDFLINKVNIPGSKMISISVPNVVCFIGKVEN